MQVWLCVRNLQQKEITLTKRFEWLANSYRFYDLKEAILLQDSEKDKTTVFKACAELNCTAENISLLWPRKNWYAKGLRDFIRLYSQVFTHIIGHEDLKKKRNAKEQQLRSLSRDDPQFNIVLRELTHYEQQMQEAYNAASYAEEEMNKIYETYIAKKPKKKWKDSEKKPEAALIAMKDSIRLEKSLFRKR